MTNLALSLTGIHKRFGPVHACKDVDLPVQSGDIHGLIGENGAGKSTLMSILYGFYSADAGDISVNGQPVKIASSQDAINVGIGMVHQHFMLVERFSVLENIVLGAEGGGLLAKGLAKARQRLQDLSKQYGLDVDPDATVGDLPVGVQQRVEILKALFRDAKILVLDEPTAVLTPQEADKLFEILAQLKEQGVTVLLITHKLKEILAITDSVSVMRQGEMVGHLETSKTNEKQLAELMVGRKVNLVSGTGDHQPGLPKLLVENIDVVDEQRVRRVKDVSLTVHAQEIVGIAGVSGNGQSALLEAIAGISPLAKGKITIGDETFQTGKRVDGQLTRAMGLSHVPEDRLRMGLVPPFAAYENVFLGHHQDDRLGTGPLLPLGALKQETQTLMDRFDVRPAHINYRASQFSGGNQQKLVLAREMSVDADVLLIGQPTRGVDIGAIEFIHQQIIGLKDAGKAILLVSAELDEIFALSSRILVMFDGRIVADLDPKNTNESEVGLLMAGGGVDRLAS